MTRNLLLATVLALLVVTAGCATDGSSTPTPDEGQTDVTVSLENSGNVSYTAEISLIPSRLRQVNVEYAKGISEPVTNLSSVQGVYAFAEKNVTEIRLPPGIESGSSSSFQLTAGSRAETNLSVPVSDATLLVVIRQSEGVAAWATVYCGQENTLERVNVRASAGNPGQFSSINLSCIQR